jgi:hypothetical protein
MNLIQEYIDYLTEVNRIVQGLSKRSGKPADHVNSIWRETDKEVVGKHKYGVTDKQKAIARIVSAKLGVKPEPDEDDGKDEPQE